MSLIFDGFSSLKRAEEFAAEVKARVNLDGHVFSDPASALAYDGPGIISFDVPVVFVDRGWDVEGAEEQAIQLAKEYGAVLVGT